MNDWRKQITELKHRTAALLRAAEAERGASAEDGLFFDVRQYSTAAKAYLALRAHTPDVFEMEHFRWRDDDDDEANATWLKATDIDITVGAVGDVAFDTNVRFRVVANNSGDSVSNGTTANIRYRLDTGGGYGSYNNINASSSVVRVADSTHLTANGATTQQIGGTGSNGFSSTTTNADTFSKQDDDDGSVTGEIDGNYYAEGEFCFQFRSADLTGHTGWKIEISVVFSNGSTAQTSVAEVVVQEGSPAASVQDDIVLDDDPQNPNVGEYETDALALDDAPDGVFTKSAQDDLSLDEDIDTVWVSGPVQEGLGLNDTPSHAAKTFPDDNLALDDTPLGTFNRSTQDDLALDDTPQEGVGDAATDDLALDDTADASPSAHAQDGLALDDTPQGDVSASAQDGLGLDDTPVGDPSYRSVDDNLALDDTPDYTTASEVADDLALDDTPQGDVSASAQDGLGLDDTPDGTTGVYVEDGLGLSNQFDVAVTEALPDEGLALDDSPDTGGRAVGDGLGLDEDIDTVWTASPVEDGLALDDDARQGGIPASAGEGLGLGEDIATVATQHQEDEAIVLDDRFSTVTTQHQEDEGLALDDTPRGDVASFADDNLALDDTPLGTFNRSAAEGLSLDDTPSYGSYARSTQDDLALDDTPQGMPSTSAQDGLGLNDTPAGDYDPGQVDGLALSDAHDILDVQDIATNAASLASQYGYSQSFISDGRPIHGGALWIRGSVSDLLAAQTITISLYAHSGTYGTSSIPTGSPLASASVNPVQVPGRVPFFFATPYAPTPGTAYTLAVEVTHNSDITFDYAFDVGAHAGNMARRNFGGVWSALPVSDLRFELFTVVPPLAEVHSGILDALALDDTPQGMPSTSAQDGLGLDDSPVYGGTVLGSAQDDLALDDTPQGMPSTSAQDGLGLNDLPDYAGAAAVTVQDDLALDDALELAAALGMMDGVALDDLLTVAMAIQQSAGLGLGELPSSVMDYASATAQDDLALDDTPDYGFTTRDAISLDDVAVRTDRIFLTDALAVGDATYYDLGLRRPFRAWWVDPDRGAWWVDPDRDAEWRQ